ncbi:hypothetical protein OY671_010725, partial [Metschnikowia pulcherrima]
LSKREQGLSVRYPHIPWSPSLFYPASPVIAAVGSLLWRQWPPASTSIVPFVPWVMASVGAAICSMYQRSQTSALMLGVLTAVAIWPMSASEAPWALGPARVWWSSAYTIDALWPERAGMSWDSAARIGVMAVGAAAITSAGKDGVGQWFGTSAVQGMLGRLGIPAEAPAAS